MTQLILKYEGQYSPDAIWTQIGGKHLGGSLWRFTNETDDMGGLLEQIIRATDPQTLNTTLALLMDDASNDCPLAALESAMPVQAMYARNRYAWLLVGLEQRIEMHLQPIVDMQAGGQVFAYEALCRLREPAGELLPGGEAFTLARQLRRQDDMDLACQHLALSRKASEIPNGIPLFMNVMPTTLLHEGWTAQCLAWLQEMAIDPRDVVIEVVESEMVDASILAERCEALRAAGLRIALDDMGAGFNGLTTLAMVRAEFIKIDRTLVHEAQGSRVRAVLLEAIVSMAERLGATVIAEGLERAEDVGFCQSMGIRLGQGYFFAPPAADLHAKPIRLPDLDDAWRARPQDRFRLTDVVEPGNTVELHANIETVREQFAQNPSLPWIVVLDQEQPVGLLSRGKILSRSTQQIGKACEPIRRVLPNNTTLSSLARSLYVSREGLEPWVVVGPDGTYLGTVQPMSLIAQILTHREHGANLHPLSQLQTGPSLRQTIETRLSGAHKMGLTYIDLDHFKSFNDRYGFIRGDAMIRTLSEILRRLFVGKPNQVLGHIGGDDFILVMDEPDGDTSYLRKQLETAIIQFHALASHLYDPEDLDRGFFTTEDGKQHPIAGVSVAVVNGNTGALPNSIAAAERAAYLKKLGKAEWGSVIVIEDTPHQIHPVRSFGDLDLWRTNAFEALGSLMNHPRGRDPHCLDAAFKAYPFFEMVFELDAKGVQRFPNWINPSMYGRMRAGGVGIDRSTQDYYSRVASNGQQFVSTIYLSTASEDFCLTLAQPLFSPTGEFSGVLVADLNLSSMAGLLDRQGTE
ncbi:MAG TPA: EAL domain-containing protein [Rhodocyclaceae bacterium]|jgi:EAL domain-containing protein (putative c-di-GMP-specific phosphodiesterase class I)/GGDEF domain-containing protein|nr:EAL domain-containing protein [Rhodocyclaceae bacterium]